jgi:hypothetical protein
VSDPTIEPSVIYRTSPLTPADYDEAIKALQAAKLQTYPNGKNSGFMCAVCEDGSHTAHGCHHNPLVVARMWAKATAIWQCYHCGFVATNDQEAREHFGASDQEPAKCLRTGISS